MALSRSSLGRFKRPLQVVVSMAICVALYRAADWRGVAASLATLNGRWLVAALALFVPQTIVSAWRWRRMIAPVATVSLGESLRHTLAASALNLVVPSKLGDFSKAAFVRVADGGKRQRLAVLCGVEKAADLAALFVILFAATRGRAAIAAITAIVVAVVAHRRYGVFAVATAVLWTLHLAQIHCFLLAADVPTSWTMTAARVPAALLAGVLPAAFCGIGTRDAALVWLFADVAPAATMAVVGMLTALRYVVPGLIGIPLLLSLRQPAEPAVPVVRSASLPRRPRPAETFATP
jgi:hypothetical protein